ncbi:hypothetical protein BSKO_00457 [Bryopsis sp. KO-2023]|nr:hypothetical protein BSKO_00457 [Bryopsis sp. KO-2023]
MEQCLIADPDRPIYHVMAARGWINDPNGPIFHDGRYHLFYQHLPDSTKWEFGIVWGHVVSTDLATWSHLPIAITPSPGQRDADGCFSGCCVLDENDQPTILYTGVRLRGNPDVGELPPPDYDLELTFFETQCCAARGGVSLPPADLLPANKLAGWRDPFIFEKRKTPEGLTEYGMLLGSGFKEEGGATLVYRSTSVLSGWRYDGMLCKAKSMATGLMWECPLLADLSSTTQGASRDHLFCISPDAPTKKVIYWLGEYKEGRFLLEDAVGPFELDLGDTLYAPNILVDSAGRALMWGWIQERNRKSDKANYSGCMTVPRVLSIKKGHLLQEPAPEIKLLRKEGGSLDGFPTTLSARTPVELVGPKGRSIDIEAVFEQGTSAMAGLFIRSWSLGKEGSVAILYDWKLNTLEAIYGFDPSICGDQHHDQFSGLRRTGGELPTEKCSTLSLRLIIDGSCVEAYTSLGAVMSVRVYRGKKPAEGFPLDATKNDKTLPSAHPGVFDSDAGSGIWCVCVGGEAQVSSLSAWEMKCAWTKESSESNEWVQPCEEHDLVPVTMRAPYGVRVGRCMACDGLHGHGYCPAGESAQCHG